MCVMENNDLVTDQTHVSNSFNKYYSSVAENILNKRNFVGDGNFMKYMPDPLPNSLFLENVDADEVEKLIKSFDTNKGIGPSSIPPKIMNLICKSIANTISKIANLSFLTGVHPEKLKVAKIVPIYKSGSKMQTSNYRPISLLSNLLFIIYINDMHKAFESSIMHHFADDTNLLFKLVSQCTIWVNTSVNTLLIS